MLAEVIPTIARPLNGQRYNGHHTVASLKAPRQELIVNRAAMPVSPMAGNAPTEAPKILLYSHDTFGLGNIRRTLLLATTLREEFPKAAILIVTGSPVVHAFRIPAGVDYIKLPCLDRVEAEQYEARFLGDWGNEVKRTRQAILNKAILGFRPDLMIVDKRPAGVDGELIETIQQLRRSGHPSKLVLGVRDILDEPLRTQKSLKTTRSFEQIKRYYDEVWIYGAPVIFDHVKEYAFPEAVARKSFYCGYLQRPTAVAARRAGPPRILVTPGGGGDGGDMIEAYLEGLLDLPRRTTLRSTVIFGPEMPGERRALLLERYGRLADVEFREFEADMTARYAEADVVVSMAGYNTVCELISFSQRAVLVPRAKPVLEQLIRAQKFAELGFFDYVEPDQLTPQILMDKVLDAVQQGPINMPYVDLGGLPRIRERVHSLLAELVS